LKDLFKIFLIFRRERNALLCFFAGVILLLTGFISAQEKPASNSTEYQLKAVFLYNFTRFIDWPENAFHSVDAPFVIGIVGDNPFGNYLQEVVNNDSVGLHPIIIKYFSKPEKVADCHLLFINSNDPEQIKSVLNITSGKSILTVNDTPNFSRWGGHVQFYNQQNRIKLQINASATKDAHLTVSSKLLNLARIY
jgi:hypothetical protein